MLLSKVIASAQAMDAQQPMVITETAVDLTSILHPPEPRKRRASGDARLAQHPQMPGGSYRRFILICLRFGDKRNGRFHWRAAPNDSRSAGSARPLSSKSASAPPRQIGRSLSGIASGYHQTKPRPRPSGAD